jgi:hypothetical protein
MPFGAFLITGRHTRLQDETGADFLVINVPWRWLATPEVARERIAALSAFEFSYVFAIRRTGRWLYLGSDSLTAICESILGQRPKWQAITV